MAFLETAANPYVTILGPEETATRRLNFSQSFNGLAAFIAPIVGGKYILSEQSLTDAQLKALSPQELSAYIAQEAASVKGPYLVLGIIIVIVMLLFVFTKLPDIKHEDDGDKSKISHAWRHKHLRWAVVAQFFYVGAQVCVLSFLYVLLLFQQELRKKCSVLFRIGRSGLYGREICRNLLYEICKT